MFSTGKKSLNSDLHSGETLFDFLKRKKKVSLQASLKKSRTFNQTNRQLIQPMSFQEQTKRTRIAATSNKKQNIGVNLTPKRVTFAQTEQRKHGTGTRSFIQMISPLKRRATIGQRQPVIQEVPTKSASKNKKSIQEVYTRKNLNSSLNIMKGTLQKFIQSGKSLKEKFHGFFIQLKPILKLVQEGQNRNFARRAQDAKLKLRTFEHLFRQFDIQNGNEIIQTFHRNLSEHITSTQAHIRAQHQKGQIQGLKKIKQQKDKLIEKLNQEKDQLEKDLGIISRRLQKSEKLNQRLKQENENQNQDLTRTLQEKVRRYDEKSTNFENQIQKLSSQLDQTKQQLRKYQKLYKDAIYTRQELQKKMIQENTKVKASKQQYLLNQIMMLKKQFHADMNQLTTLYTTKEKDQLVVIEQLRKQIDQLNSMRKYDRQIQTKVSQDATAFKVQVAKYKRQNECLVTDMHRMNEELYQHWLALKDIKTLANRLQILHKFSKIYEDLNYNERLFD